MPLKFKAIGKTDIGLVRKGNEDYLHLDEANGVVAVCDGMGGHQAGEVASMSASETLRAVFTHFPAEIRDDSDLSISQTVPVQGEILLKAIRLANRRIFTRSAADPALSGMGTTVVALAFEKDILSVAHVGDSRAYKIEDNRLIPLTEDHSWIAEIQKSQTLTSEEASTMVGKNVITRALGVRETVEVDYRAIKIKPGDRFLLCSDGLCGFADDEDIFQVVYSSQRSNEEIADNLVQMANDRGGADNVTIVVVEIEDIEESDYKEVELFTLPEETPAILHAEDEWNGKIQDFEPTENEPVRVAHEPEKKGPPFWLFAAFIIVAAAIIYIAVK